jgi:branched-chain amino acid transport system permease protein
VSLVELIFGNTPGFIHFDLSDHVNTASAYISGNRLMGMLLSMLVIVVFFVYLKYTSVGIRIRALRDNELLGRVFGMRTGRLQSGLFALSGIFAGLASCLSAIDVGVNPQLGIPVFINAFVALVIGGTGRFDGPVLGGLMLGLLQALTEYFFDSKWVMMVTFMMLILFLLVRPQGLIPEKTRTF